MILFLLKMFEADSIGEKLVCNLLSAAVNGSMVFSLTKSDDHDYIIQNKNKRVSAYNIVDLGFLSSTHHTLEVSHLIHFTALSVCVCSGFDVIVVAAILCELHISVCVCVAS